ncbi:hypothetical protein Dda3937_01589 [Dickeya dadantii 3937]|uniref:Uncharacterized protein n=1 Tax=Dickeya dadantii (strain 3937) TaxID=198628 RepID=E0SH82_DICD3|nr:hypothetical protein [Dickeya dadantii]ADM96481.1 hypothetical protein Dda3937_01589 [Dickeya dadantii 3937]
MSVKKPERLYYPLHEAAEKLECSIKDIIHYGAIGALCISVYMFNNKGDNQSDIFYLDALKFKVDDDLPSHFLGDKYLIADIHFNHSPYGWCASFLKGFFYINAVSLTLAEFEINSGSIKIDKLSTAKNALDSIDIYFMNDEGLYELPISRLCVMAEEIDNINQAVKINAFINQEKESDKTVAKKEVLIKSLLRLIPDFYDVDIEAMPVKKIKELLEVTAAQKGIDFPKTDLGTWSKYLERGRHKK